MSTTVGVPMMNVAFVDDKKCLTQYGYAILAGLRTRSGGTDGIDITDLQTQLEGDFQDIREAPLVPALGAGAFAQASADDQPLPVTFIGAEPDEPSLGPLFAYIARLESRIAHLEESK